MKKNGLTRKPYVWLAALFLLTACDDSKPVVNIYHKEITQTPLPCMKLTVFPEEKDLSDALMKLYPFKNDCPLVLSVSYKSSIHCNSGYNACRQALGNFPTSYLKMELRRGLGLQYSYYIDLNSKPDGADVQKGFERMEKDLKIGK